MTGSVDVRAHCWHLGQKTLHFIPQFLWLWNEDDDNISTSLTGLRENEISECVQNP